ncbi:acetoacetate decarboxylase family protein [Erythrobacter sp.]|uniref:acetoacetate decarboxylase family protein n=1 Tax=Erythrobacter sp. TaxID=1042 RepID=UPI001B24FEAC|nr:acetoacetate decarboxylase family protein [Erythrobacter sp.]MBO6527559.1 acetoacetate decarboxylase family protein [Erythrobacter sp.]MBO6530239.1 acetoacetate decarboxylase family protein [Erythrobacter sp.]
MFEGLVADSDLAQADRIPLPLRYQDLSFAFLTFAADEALVAPHLPDPRLRPVQIAPDKVALAVSIYDYRQCDLAPYLECGVSVLVETQSEPGISPPPSGFPALHYVHRLPVTTERSRRIGRAHWGFPKFLGEISFAMGPDTAVGCVIEPDRYRLDLEAFPGNETLDRRLRLRPLLVPGPITIAHVVIEGTGMIPLDDATLQLEFDEGFSDPILSALSEAVFMEGVACQSASALLSGVIESFPAQTDDRA